MKLSLETIEQFSKQKQRTDVAQAFLVFMATIGDTEKTALALDLDPEFIGWLAEQEGWTAKVRRVSLMSKGEKPGDWERAQNRCLNYIQAHRVRTLIDRLLVELTNCSADDFLTRFRNLDKHGQPTGMSGRFFADLMAALSKVHELSYYALGDSVGERLERAKEEGGDHSVADIHAALIAALNNPSVSAKTSQLLVEEASSVISAEMSERKNPGEASEQSLTMPTPVASA